MNIPLVKMSLPQSTLAEAKRLVGFDYGDDFYHVLLFDFGDDGGAIGVWREGDNFCARITLDALAEFNAQARDPRSMSDALQLPSLDRNQRRVVCAAIRATDGELLLGVRHYSADMHRQIHWRKDGERFKNRLDDDQGFVDQHGVYMDRAEAFDVADRAGQITNLAACGTGLCRGKVAAKLYSEGLY